MRTSPSQLRAIAAVVACFTSLGPLSARAAAPSNPAVKDGKNSRPTTTPEAPKVDTLVITVSEGSTASAMRGATAAPPSSGPGPRFAPRERRGQLSPDAENPHGERDPAFVSRPQAIFPAGAHQIILPAGRVYLKDMPNAQEITTTAARRVGDQTINVALLAQHKYMISDCLGVKVSAGTFSLKLGSPSIRIVDEGVVASYTIDSVSFTAFKLRFRPDVTDLAEPCHFSGRVELGGTARNITVALRYNPVVDIEKCRIGEPGHLYLHLDVGSMHLAPLPPGLSGLENVFKDMLVDALNDGFYYAQLLAGATDPTPMLLNQMIQTLDDVLEVDCPTKGSEAGKQATTAVASEASRATNITTGQGTFHPLVGMRLPPASAPTPYELVADAGLKGRLGHIVIAFPAGTKIGGTRIDLFKSGDATKIRSDFGDVTIEILPGTYDLVIGGRKISGIPWAGSRMRSNAPPEV